MGRWTAMFFGLFGSYGKNDSVDVQYRLGNREAVATGLDIIPPAASGAAASQGWGRCGSSWFAPCVARGLAACALECDHAPLAGKGGVCRGAHPRANARPSAKGVRRISRTVTPVRLMRIDRILEERRPVFSFEFFPPKTDEGQQGARGHARRAQGRPARLRLGHLRRGRLTRDRTVEITKWIKQDLGIEAMAHLTCVGTADEKDRRDPRRAAGAGIENILALRGDPPRRRVRAVAPRLRVRLHHSVELIGRSATSSTSASAPPASRRAFTPRREPGAGPPVRQGARSTPARLPDHPALLRQRATISTSSTGPRGRYLRADRPRHHAHHPVQADQDDHRAVRGVDPVGDGARVERARRRPEAVAELGVAYAALQCSDLLARGAPGPPPPT